MDVKRYLKWLIKNKLESMQPREKFDSSVIGQISTLLRNQHFQKFPNSQKICFVSLIAESTKSIFSCLCLVEVSDLSWKLSEYPGNCYLCTEISKWLHCTVFPEESMYVPNYQTLPSRSFKLPQKVRRCQTIRKGSIFYADHILLSAGSGQWGIYSKLRTRDIIG